MRTWRDIYQCGRKHCSRCKHWRHGIDFHVRKWADEPGCTIPLMLSSVCKTCNTIAHRERKSTTPKKYYPHGRPGSQRWLEHRRKRNRETAKQRRADTHKRELELEYQRIYRNAKSGSRAKNGNGSSHTSDVDMKDAQPFLEWCNTFQPFLTEDESRSIRAAKKTGRISIIYIDSVMTREGMTDQMAILYGEAP